MTSDSQRQMAAHYLATSPASHLAAWYDGPVESPPPNASLLRRLETGEPEVAEQMMPLVYDELRRIAQRLLGDQPQGHTLQATALIHEAWIRLGGEQGEFEDARHFVRVAARAMRFALVDHARRRGSDKRGGSRAKITLDEQLFEVADRSDSVLAIDESLAKLAENDVELAHLVELKFFGGLTHEQIAAALDMSLRSVERKWRLARAWLVAAIEEE